MSVLCQHLDEYLRLRRLLGHQLNDAARLLPRFVSYLDAHDIEFVTVQAAVDWSLEPEAPTRSTVWGRWFMVARGFARYLSGIDPRTEIPPAGLIPICRQWRPPFIYSEQDILALMDEARRSIPQPLRAATYRTLIALLACTGLRVGEALRLDRRDVDSSEGVLIVRRSKFGKSRVVPLDHSTVEALAEYARQRDRFVPAARRREFLRLATWHAGDLRMRVADPPDALPKGGCRR